MVPRCASVARRDATRRVWADVACAKGLGVTRSGVQEIMERCARLGGVDWAGVVYGKVWGLALGYIILGTECGRVFAFFDRNSKKSGFGERCHPLQLHPGSMNEL